MQGSMIALPAAGYLDFFFAQHIFRLAISDPDGLVAPACFKRQHL